MAEEEKEEKKSSKLLPIILGAVGGIVLLLAGLALGFFLFSSPAADPSAEVDEIIEKNFKDHPGNTNQFWFATEYDDVLKLLNFFIKEKSNLFGDYEDAVSKKSNILFL